MTNEEMIELFDRIKDEELLKFNKPVLSKHKRCDLNAMLILDELCPGTGDIIAYAGHDEIAFDTDINELARVITTEQIRELVRCGVFYQDDSLYMYV